MQQPLPQATPVVPVAPPDPNLPIDRDLPDLTAKYRGWYPRWWLLSAIFCAIFIGLVALLQPVVCQSKTSGGLLCRIDLNVSWQQAMIVILIWLMFLIGWLIALVFGVGTIEVSRQHRNPIAWVLRTISEFQTVYILLYAYSAVAFCSIFITWRLNLFQPMMFSLWSIVLFVANCCFLYTRRPAERRSYILGYMVLAAFSSIITIWIGPFQVILFSSEIIVLLICVVIFWRSRHPANPSAQFALTAVNAATIRPGQVFMALLHSFVRRNVAQNNPPNQAQPAQQQNNPNQGI